MSNFKKMFNLKILIAIATALHLLISVSYSSPHLSDSLRLPVAKNTYERIIEIIQGELRKLPSNRKKPIFTIWVVCNQNRERSPIVTSIINENIPEDIRQYFKVKSYGLKVKSDPYVDEAVSKDRFLRSHVPMQIPYDDIDKADLILVMTKDQKKALIRAGAARSKVKMVMEGENLALTYVEGSVYDVFREKIRHNIDTIMVPIFSACSEKIQPIKATDL